VVPPPQYGVGMFRVDVADLRLVGGAGCMCIAASVAELVSAYPVPSLLSDLADLDFRGLILYCQSNLTLCGTSHVSTSLLSVTLPSPAGLQVG
jgi:hypothetical protein